MSAREMRNLLLEYRTGERDGRVADIILANIPGQRYTFGTLNPGEREGEKFLLCRGYEGGIVGPSHCTIRVDDQGQYWIQDYTTNPYETKRAFSFYETFVNSKRVEASESRLLKSGDIISLGAPETEWAGGGLAPHPIYRVKEGKTGSAGSQIDGKENEDGDGPKYDPEESPLENGLILSKIMSYLPLPDLKSARLVNKMWKGEASILLEKRGKVSFNFGALCQYVSTQKDSKNVDRYFLEMEGLKLQNLHIRLPYCHCGKMEKLLCYSPGRPERDEVMSDLTKLLSSTHKFFCLSLTCPNIREATFPFLFLTLQELGGKVVELEIEADFSDLPKDLPPLPVMSNLRKLTHNTWMSEKFTGKWASYFVPLFAKELEHFYTEQSDLGEAYLQEFLKQEMPKLKGIAIEEGPEGKISENSLSSLLQLKTPLTLLKLHYIYKKERSDLLEKLLFKNSQSLTHLTLTLYISHKENYESFEVKFPPFPKLEELVLNYLVPSRMRITWESESGDLDYTKHLPRLRKLSVVNCFRRARDYAGEDDPVFKSFFPEDGAVGRRETVKGVHVLVLEAKAEQEMDRIKETFPNAVLSFVRGEEWCGEDNEYPAENAPAVRSNEWYWEHYSVEVKEEWREYWANLN